MKTRIATLLPLFVLVLLACEDGAAPDPPLAPGSVDASSHASPEQEIEDAIAALFPAPGLRNAALQRFRNVVRELNRTRGNGGNAVEAQAVALVEFTLQKLANDQLLDPNGVADPGTEEAVVALVDDLYAFAGLGSPPTVQLQTQESVIAVVSDTGGAVTTGDEFAGVEVPDASTDETTIIAIQRLDQDPCLPTGLPQYEGCYQFDKFPDTAFPDSVVVGVCVDPAVTGTTEDRILLHRFDPDSASLGVRPLENVAAPFLDCSGFTVASADAPWPVRLARDGLRRLSEWLVPPARAAHTGAGGLTISFSDFGWVLPPELAFDSDRDGNLEVYRSNPSGHGFIRLTHNDSADYNPKWSRDGLQLAFGSRRTGDLEAYTMDNDGLNVTQVTTNPGYDLPHSWSPADTMLAITSVRGMGLAIYLIDSDGSGGATLLDLSAGSPDISPDGSEVVYEGSDVVNGGLDIFTVDIDGTGAATLIDDPVSAARPTWSPDGTRIAFLSVRDGNGEIYLADADGTNLTRLTYHPSSDTQPVWSPDGTRIAFQTYRNGNYDIYVINVDGTGLTQITTSPARDRNPHWRSVP